VIQRRNADPVCAISSVSGKRQPMTTQIRIFCSTKFALDLNTGSGNSSEVKKIDNLIGHCAAWNNSARYVRSHRHCAAGFAEVNAHLSGTNSGAARVNTPAALPSVPLTAAAPL